MIILRLCVTLFSSVLVSSSLAALQVFVVGLFPGAAVLDVDGQRKSVRVGQTGPQGVQMVSADSRKTVLRIDGVERTYELSCEYNEAGYSAPQRQSFSIACGTGGHYWVTGSVNGQNMQFLVDTGATSIVMNENEVRHLGIDYRVDGKPMAASTASGTSCGWRVIPGRVKIGGIELLGVEATVIEGGYPTEALLGMSFLNRVRWREERGVLLIEAKH